MGAQKGHSEVWEMLIDYKVNKNHNTYYQPSPLQAEAENGYSVVCTILLENQADKNPRENNFGWTMLSSTLYSNSSHNFQKLCNKWYYSFVTGCPIAE